MIFMQASRRGKRGRLGGEKDRKSGNFSWHGMLKSRGVDEGLWGRAKGGEREREYFPHGGSAGR